jgi:hypothetical protein
MPLGLHITEGRRIMRNFVRYTVIATVLSLTFGIFHGPWADDRHRGGAHEGGAEKQDLNGKIHLNAVTNKTYKEACGACHFAYQPGLLPSGSWEKLLSNLKDHFGETVEIDAVSKGVIEKYLIDNAAEKSQMKRSRKIVRCLKGETPLRITEIRYVRRKHRDISPEVFKRKTGGSLSNCSACHRTADQGIYEEHNVTIPK